MSGRSSLSSVHNALLLLRQFSGDEPVLGVTELATRLGCAKSTTHRLLSTLASEGFVRKTEDGRYALGIALWELGSQMVGGLQLREVAHPILEKLRNETGETVHLAILEGSEVVYIDRFESQATLTLFRRLGLRMPAHATSSGKSILAFSPPEIVDSVISDGLKKLAPGTVTRKREFRDLLATIRDKGFVVSRDESEQGVVSVGAPVFNHKGSVAGAVSIAGPATRFPESTIESHTRRVRRAANDISTGLGNPRTLRVAK